MDRKTIGLIIVCPVLLAGCGEKPVVNRVFTEESHTGRAEPASPFQVARPDSMVSYLVLAGNSPLVVLETGTAETVEAGDTAAICADPFLEMEIQRKTMELEFALATGDSSRADSLFQLLADSSVYIPVVFTEGGGRVEIMVLAGEEIHPGDTVASVTVPPSDSVYIVMPGEGHLRWPEGIEGIVLSSGRLMCRGNWPGNYIRLPGFYAVESHFIHEVGLGTFLFTPEDTLQVMVTGNLNGMRTVYSAVSLDTLTLTGWN